MKLRMPVGTHKQRLETLLAQRPLVKTRRDQLTWRARLDALKRDMDAAATHRR